MKDGGAGAVKVMGELDQQRAGRVVTRSGKDAKPTAARFTPVDLAFWLEFNADFINADAWPGDTGRAEIAACRDAARGIRKRAELMKGKGSAKAG